MNETQVRWASGLNLLAGLWLMFSPLWVRYTVAGDAWQQVVLGAVLGLIAIGRMAVPRVAWPSLVNLAIGIYFIIAPWVVNSTVAVRWNQVLLGVIVGVLSIWSAASAFSTDEETTTATGKPAGAFYERIDKRR